MSDDTRAVATPHILARPAPSNKPPRSAPQYSMVVGVSDLVQSVERFPGPISPLNLR